MAKRATPTKTAPSQADDASRLSLILMALILGGWVLLSIALVSYSKYDPPSNMIFEPGRDIANWAGKLGAFVSHHIHNMFGLGSWVLWLGLTVLMGAYMMGKRWGQLPIRPLGLSNRTDCSIWRGLNYVEKEQQSHN